jgi:hypothetical protein
MSSSLVAAITLNCSVALFSRFHRFLALFTGLKSLYVEVMMPGVYPSQASPAASALFAALEIHASTLADLTLRISGLPALMTFLPFEHLRTLLVSTTSS